MSRPSSAEIRSQRASHSSSHGVTCLRSSTEGRDSPRIAGSFRSNNEGEIISPVTWSGWVGKLGGNLDPPTRRDWEKHIGTKVDLPSLETLSEFISGRIRALQSSDLRTPKAPVSYKAPRSAKSFATLSSDLCPECKGDHRLNNCNKFLCSNSRERMAIVRRVQVCFKCLRANHWAGECRSGRPCSVCSSGHHDLLHDGLTRKRSSAGEVGQENLSKKRKFSGANAEVAPGARDAPRS